MAGLYLIFGAAVGLWALPVVVYNLYFHPLKGIPGPFLARISRWWLFVLEIGGILIVKS